jgi:predicted RNase H-like HicB family nuclease
VVVNPNPLPTLLDFPLFLNHEVKFMPNTYTAIVERCPDTGLYVGYVPGFPGAHSQADTLDELQQNLQEVVTMLLEDGQPELTSEYVGTQTLVMA